MAPKGNLAGVLDELVQIGEPLVRQLIVEVAAHEEHDVVGGKYLSVPFSVSDIRRLAFNDLDEVLDPPFDIVAFECVTVLNGFVSLKVKVSRR